MTLRLYFDEDAIRHSLVEALRKRGIDVQTALDAEKIQASDEEQLEFASSHGRVLYTFNMGDFCRIHTAWMTEGREHSGIIVGRQQQHSVGEQIRRLMRIMASRSADDMRNRIAFLSEWGKPE